MARVPTAAVVTGAGSGLGRALALEVARRGAKVVVADVDVAGAEDTAGQVRAAGGTAFVERCDVRDAEAVRGLLDAAHARTGGVDLWVNNAGVAVAGEIGTVPLEDWRWVVDVNLWGVVHGCEAAVPYLKGRGAGWVLNVASAAGLLSTPRLGPYNVTKAAVVSLSETMYGELKDAGVGVTVLCPTFFRTNIMAASRGAADQRAMVGKLMDRSALQAPDVARIALDDLLAGRLYSVPMTDGRLLWSLRRVAPQLFYTLVPKVMARLR
jgi:NAD(P)-dependent dehydrogenase (short-subunit alcohol dehydrogenase family)